MGNCGVTFAPVDPGDRAFLAEMMESVEDIPRDAILDGLPWDWDDLPAVPRLGAAHAPGAQHRRPRRSLRRPLPRDGRAVADRRGADAGRAGPDAGHRRGVGGRRRGRLLDVADPAARVPDGRYVPGTYAPIDEYLAIADGMNDAGRRPVPGGQRLRDQGRATRSQLAARDGRACGRRAVLRRGRQRRVGRRRRGRPAGTASSPTPTPTSGRITGYTMSRPSGSAVRARPGPAGEGRAVEGGHDAAHHGRPRRRPAATTPPGPSCSRRAGEGHVLRPPPHLPARHGRLARLRRRGRGVDRRPRRQPPGCTRSSW